MLSVNGIICPVPNVQTLPIMQGYPYDIWTIKFWTVKFPGGIWIAEIWTVKTGLGLRLGFGLVTTVQFDCPEFDCAIKTCNQGTAAPLFCPCLLSSNDWIDQGAIWYGLWRYVSGQTTLC